MSLTQAQLKKVFRYNPETGIFTRLQHFNSAKMKPHRGTLQPHGYYRICIDYKLYYAHRLAWLYVYGNFPIFELDHINGDRSDNRIINLREARRSQNNSNAKRRSDNTSGYKGVSWNSDCKKWAVQIVKDGKHYHLGLFVDPILAAERYDIEAVRLFGVFAKLNFSTGGCNVVA